MTSIPKSTVWARAHPESAKASRQRWRKANPEKARESQRASDAKWKRNNLERFKQSRNRATLKYRYGITPEELEQRLRAQHYKCAICRAPLVTQGNNRHVDHKGTLVRGVLCRQCNVGLGHFKDDPKLLYAAARYLQRVSHASDTWYKSRDLQMRSTTRRSSRNNS